MDTELARTFLAIVSTGSFVRAAERLHVAQTTVSARIRLLETQLGQPLFDRNKNGASLTHAGEQFLRYAPSFVQLWQQVRQQMAVPTNHRTMLTIGGEVSLWQPLLLDWVIWMHQEVPDVALHVQVDLPGELVNQVADGLIDAAVMYVPTHRPGIKVELLMEEKLVLVSTNPDAKHVHSPGFVSADWGPAFWREYAVSFPNAESPGLAFNLGPLALSFILAVGGSGYFRLQAVKPHLLSGKLHCIEGAPDFSYPIYIVKSVSADDELLTTALAGLRTVVRNYL